MGYSKPRKENRGEKIMSLESKLAGLKLDKEELVDMGETLDKSSTGQWLGLGVHTVKIDNVELTESKSGTIGITFEVSNQDGKGEATMWLSERALKYTISNISKIAIHNVAENKRAELKEALKKIDNAKAIYDIARGKLIGKEAFLEIKESETQTYTNKFGEEKSSLEKNLLSYKPKVEVQSIAKAQVASGTINDNGEIDLSELPFSLDGES